MEEIIQVRLDEFDQLMTFLARAYGCDGADWFPKHYGHIYKREPENLKNSFIIKDKDRIVSHVGLFPLEVLVGTSVFKVGGIGGVGTDPDYRGHGLMRQLLEFVINKMEKEGYSFSVLWGDRQRYGNFGWEFGGRKLVININERSLAWKGVKEGEIRRYNGEAEILEKIIALHEPERLKVKRSREIYQLLMKKAGFEVWLGKESYIVLSGEGKIRDAVESGGDPLGILSLALRLIKGKGLEGIRISRPYEESGINRILLDASSGWCVEILCSIKIINFSRTIKGFQNAVQRRDRDKYSWPKDEEELLKKIIRLDNNLFDFYIWELDHV